MADQPMERRVRRSHRLLIDALLELIVERGYEALTVQDILDRADIGRSTFYAHFRDKDDLLHAAFARLPAVLVAQTSESDGLSLATLSLALFRHTAEHGALYRSLVGRPSGTMLMRYLTDVLTAHAREHLSGYAENLAVPVEVASRYYVSAMLGLLTWWLDNDCPYPPVEIDAMFRRLALVPLEDGERKPPGK